MSEWLGGHGGFCDCKILLNVEPKFEEFGVDLDGQDEIKPAFNAGKAKSEPNLTRSNLNAPARQKIGEIRTGFGFDLPAIPAPWSAYRIGDEYELQIGKKRGYGSCTGRLAERFELDSLAQDESFLMKFCNDRFGRSKIGVEREKFGSYEIVVASSPHVITAQIWCVHLVLGWCLEFETEITRLRGDIKEIRALLGNINEQMS